MNIEIQNQFHSKISLLRIWQLSSNKFQVQKSCTFPGKDKEVLQIAASNMKQRKLQRPTLHK